MVCVCHTYIKEMTKKLLLQSILNQNSEHNLVLIRCSAEVAIMIY